MRLFAPISTLVAALAASSCGVYDFVDDGGRDASICPGPNCPPDANPSDASISVDPPFFPCRTDDRQVALIPLDILLLLDESGSMLADSKWQAVKSAAEGFVTAPTSNGLRVGLQYFPGRYPAYCTLAEYEAPAVPISLLPESSFNLQSSLASQNVSGSNGSPTVPAVTGSLNYLRSYVSDAGADHKGILVFATDGLPDYSCTSGMDGGALPNNVANIVKVAEEAYNGAPSIQTFVIGVGANLGFLNEVAAAGGSGSALLVDVGANTSSDSFVRALDGIRRSALGCDFAPPRNYDPAVVNINRAFFTFTENQKEIVFPEVPSEMDCSADGGFGWYFTNPNQTADGGSNVIRLCKGSCDYFIGGATGTARVRYACSTQ